MKTTCLIPMKLCHYLANTSASHHEKSRSPSFLKDGSSSVRTKIGRTLPALPYGYVRPLSPPFHAFQPLLRIYFRPRFDKILVLKTPFGQNLGKFQFLRPPFREARSVSKPFPSRSQAPWFSFSGRTPLSFPKSSAPPRGHSPSIVLVD